MTKNSYIFYNGEGNFDGQMPQPRTEHVLSETILVIDDGEDNRDFLVKYVLKPNGYKAFTAVDGQEGFQMVQKRKPDLILLDLQMPRMNGIQFLEALNEEAIDIPVILMTFHGSEEVAVEVHRLGVKDYVKKPFAVDEMLEAIERNLMKTRLIREKEALTERVLQANRELQSRLQELNILYNVGKSVTSVTDMDALLPRIVDAAIQITQAEEAYIFLLEGDNLVCRAQRMQSKPKAEASEKVTSDRILRHVIETKQAVVLGVEQTINRKGPNAPASLIYQPLLINERVLGVLSVHHVSSQAIDFTPHQVALLSALSDYATISIENSNNYTLLRTQKEQIHGTFERFVPPTVVEQALSDPDIRLGGTRREVTVLFADIRGYTAWSENNPPEMVIELLNNYLSLAAELVLGWEGTLDKFLGDGLMALFNAPNDQPDHVVRAADAALALVRAAQEVIQQHGYNLSFSIGVHVGEAVVGYIGTERAINYTAIGDVVNVAKRLQENAEAGQVLIHEDVMKRLQTEAKEIKVEKIGKIEVKGRKQKSVTYRLLEMRR